MATQWFVKFDGVNDYFIPDSSISIPASTPFEIEVLATVPSDFSRILGNTTGYTSRLLIFNTTNEVRLTDSLSNDASFTAPAYTKTDLNSFKFIRDVSGNVDFYLNNDYVSTVTGFNGSFDIDRIGRQFSAFTRGDLGLLRINVNNSPLHDWNANTADHGSTGVQPALIDTVSGNTLTGANMPTNGSAWGSVEVGEAVTADGSLTVAAPSLAATASVTIPQPEANGNFSIVATTFTSSASVTLPNPISNGSFSLPFLLFNGAASTTMPSPVANGDFTVPAITFVGDSSVTVPNPVGNGAFSVPSALFSGAVDVSVAYPVSDGAFSDGQLIFTGEAVATLPSPISNGMFTIGSPVFLGSASVSGGFIQNTTNIIRVDSPENIIVVDTPQNIIVIT